MSASTAARPSHDLVEGLARIGTPESVPRNGVIFRQSAAADAVFYLVEGLIKLEVLSRQGKKATIALHGPGVFFGESALRRGTVRLATAKALTPARLIKLPAPAMVRALRSDTAFSDGFMLHLLQRLNRVEEDLVDRLFNDTEKRLGRALLLLSSQLGSDSSSLLAKVSQQTLAEIVGTTRPRISHFMSKFRRLGLVSYDGQLRVRSSLLDVVMGD